MTVLAGGNVGVAAPTTKLHVAVSVPLRGFAAAGLPSASNVGAGALAYVGDTAGRPALACSDGADCRVGAALGALIN